MRRTILTGLLGVSLLFVGCGTPPTSSSPVAVNSPAPIAPGGVPTEPPLGNPASPTRSPLKSGNQLASPGPRPLHAGPPPPPAPSPAPSPVMPSGRPIPPLPSGGPTGAPPSPVPPSKIVAMPSGPPVVNAPGPSDTTLEPKPKNFPSAGQPDPANILRVYVLADGSLKPDTLSAKAGPTTLFINNYGTKPAEGRIFGADVNITVKAGPQAKVVTPLKVNAGEYKIEIGSKVLTLSVK